MSSAITTVQELIEGFNTIDMVRIAGCFADDAIYHNIPMEVVQGVDAIRQVLGQFMESASEVQWDLLNIAEDDSGNVLTERVDKFKINDMWIELPVMGTFEVKDGKVTAWRDYFDLNQFQEQFAKAMSG